MASQFSSVYSNRLDGDQVSWATHRSKVPVPARSGRYAFHRVPTGKLGCVSAQFSHTPPSLLFFFRHLFAQASRQKPTLTPPAGDFLFAANIRTLKSGWCGRPAPESVIYGELKGHKPLHILFYRERAARIERRRQSKSLHRLAPVWSASLPLLVRRCAIRPLVRCRVCR